jgi:hypothetical protein
VSLRCSTGQFHTIASTARRSSDTSDAALIPPVSRTGTTIYAREWYLDTSYPCGNCSETPINQNLTIYLRGDDWGAKERIAVAGQTESFRSAWCPFHRLG